MKLSLKMLRFTIRLWLAVACQLFTAGGPVLAAADEGSCAAELQAANETEAAADAQQEDEAAEPVRLFEELLVIGSAEAARKIPGSAHVIDAEQLERQGYSDIHRILRQIPGVNIQEEEGYGLRPNIGIRGTGVDRSQKVTLLEDGVLIAPAPYAAPSAYYSPTAGRMESFEVRKGSSAVRQGPHTNGGALNYISTSIPGSFGGRVELAAGEDNLRRARASVGDSGERFGWLLETYQLETDGFKSLDGGGGTGFDLEDYVAKLRFNSRPDVGIYQALELKLGATEQFGEETYLGLTQGDFDRDPFRRYASSAGDNIRTDHQQLQLSYFIRPSERFHLTATLYRNDFFRNWFKLEQVNGTGVAGILANPEAFPQLLAILRGEADSDPRALQVRNNRRDYYSEGIQAVLSWQLGPAEREHDLDLGIRYHQDREDRFQEEDLFRMSSGERVLTELGVPGSNANRIADAEALALFIQDTFSLGRWTLTPGLRIESIRLMRRDFGRSDPARTGARLALRDNDLTAVIPGIGADYRLDDAASLFLGVHRGFSPPSPSSTREVDVEESINYELGWRYRAGGSSAEVVGFFNDYDNLLGNDTVSTGGQGTSDQFNGGAVAVAGLEASFGIQLAGTGSRVRVPLRLAYTYSTAQFRDTFETSFSDWQPLVERGDQLPYIPENQLYAGLSVEGERWAVHLDASYSSAMRTRSGRGPIPDDQKIESRFLIDLRAEVSLANGVKIWGQLLNATDEVYVAARRPAGLRPGRPRATLFGLSFDFGGR